MHDIFFYGSPLHLTLSAHAYTGSQPSDTSNSSNHSSKDSSIPLLLCEDLGLDMQQLQTLDSEGRALITDHGLFVLVNLYGPALTSEERAEERLGFKLNLYKVLFRLCNLIMFMELVLGGRAVWPV